MNPMLSIPSPGATRLLLAACLLALLAACGQKGDLYLPDAPAGSTQGVPDDEDD